MLDECKHHLHSVNESYIEHMTHAIRFGLRMIGGGLGAMIHAICPALCKSTASKTVATLHAELQERIARAHNE